MSNGSRSRCPDYILSFISEKLGPSFTTHHVESVKSSQHTVCIVHVKQNVNDAKPACWEEALVAGGFFLVVRIWKGSSRWWNLNHPQASDDLDTIVQNEIWGYCTARRLVLGTESDIMIPRVLYVSSCRDGQQECSCKLTPCQPWAIFEYVGPRAKIFQDSSMAVDTSWIDSMVKVREEYGFPEPHPRWGRVPVAEALQYSMQLLQSVVVPLHTSDVPVVDSSTVSTYTYDGMVSLYLEKFQKYLAPCCDSNDDGSISLDLRNAINKLGDSIRELARKCELGQTPSPLPPRVCHLDLQPQNVLCVQVGGVAKIKVIFDWEEASFSDPRFELLMIGRKVCANERQAETVWKSYERLVGVSLGKIDAWLELEVVHSLCSLLLQALSGGGRSPWESIPDLRGKIDRELQRLARRRCHGQTETNR